MSSRSQRHHRGFTLIEILIASAVASMLLLGLTAAIQITLSHLDATTNTERRIVDAGHALQRMTEAVRYTRVLMLPLADNPATDWRENVREQTVPPSPPEGSSTLATAVLAVTLSPRQDLDGDGWADANEDKDFLDIDGDAVRDPGEPERIDEDPSDDLTGDARPGIIGIDDDGDGLVDEGGDDNDKDDDEDGDTKEDGLDGIDNDGDGSIDEDAKADWAGHNDGKSGFRDIDDDLDGLVDEHNNSDDDEDGLLDEDDRDPVVYYLSGTDLIERIPVFYDSNGDATINGADFIESVIAENVTAFRVERIALPRGVLVDLSLTIGTGETAKTFATRTRVGAGL